jgi:hypothetical protein
VQAQRPAGSNPRAGALGAPADILARAGAAVGCARGSCAACAREAGGTVMPTYAVSGGTPSAARAVAAVSRAGTALSTARHPITVFVAQNADEQQTVASTGTLFEQVDPSWCPLSWRAEPAQCIPPREGILV